MIFEWDDNKDTANRAKHGISFEEAATIFKGLYISREDDRFDYGEKRIVAIGLLGGELVVVVVHTERADRIRIISARLANQRERQIYDDYRNQKH